MKILFTEVEPADEPTIRDLCQSHDIQIYGDIPSEDEIIQMADPEVEVISTFIYTKIGPKVIDHFPNLKLIATRSTGFDHIDIRYAAEKNIPVCNVPQYGFNTVAEHAFALLLDIVRHLSPSWDRVRTGNFDYHGFRGIDLKEKTMGILGTGKIGQHAAKIAKGFEMEVLAFDVFQNHEAAREIGFEYVELDELLAKSDMISIHVPLLDSTRHLINDESIAKMKPGMIIINTARGGIVNTDAVVRGLQSGKLGGAGLDVVENELAMTKDHPLLNAKNVIVSPHTAFYTHEAMTRIINTTYENITAFEKGEPVNRVN